MSEMTATRIALTLVTALLWLGAAAWLWRTDVPVGLEVVELSKEELFPPETVAHAEEYARLPRLLWLGRTGLELALLVVLALGSRALVERLRGGAVARSLQALIVVLVALWLVGLPFGIAGHWWRRRYDLTDQGYAAWLVYPWPELLGTLLLAAAALLAGIGLARRLGDRWWLAGAPVLAALGAASVLAQPLLLAPRLEPLDDPGLERLVHAVAGEGVGLEVKQVAERTRALNAEVAGIGPTRRVVLWETALDGRLREDGVRFLAAHEAAHVRRRHLWRGVAWLALLALPGAWVLARATRRSGGLAEPAAVPAAVLAVVAFQLATLPLASAVSRRYEAEADWIGARATGQPAGPEAFFTLLPETNLTDPEPPRWSTLLRGTHPSLVDRVEQARAAALTPARAAP
jgi:STE24 endopeptidase